MRVAVLGGGLQGCATALALDSLGIEVTLFERDIALMTRAATANEGKIHLGYMYAADDSLATARAMMQGALAFAPFFARELGGPVFSALSEPAVYLVHREGQRNADAVRGYLKSTHDLLAQALSLAPGAYFGRDIPPPREWHRARAAEEFGPDICAAFDTGEVAIDPGLLAASVRAAIAARPQIQVRTGCRVEGVDDPGRPAVAFTERGAREREVFDHVVNALWDGRLAIDRQVNGDIAGPWIHRLKFGVSFRQPDDACRRSATIISGPFGEVVAWPDGLTYLTWYPACLKAISHALSPPDWPNRLTGPEAEALVRETFSALAALVRPLGDVDLAAVEDLTVKGGAIVAWGETDIYDPASALHGRWRIGVSTRERYHSIDPGKLTMIPFFADICARRIAASA